MTNNQLEGHVEQMVTSLVDHPNWEIFKEAGHPWERVEEFFGLEGKQWLDASSEFREEAEHRAKEDDGPTGFDADFAPEVFMEHKRRNIVNHPDGRRTTEFLPSYGNVNIRPPAPIDTYNYGVKVGRDMQNMPLHDGKEDVFSPWNDRYKGQRIGPHSQNPFSDQDQMKYASEPFDQAWNLMKAQPLVGVLGYTDEESGNQRGRAEVRTQNPQVQGILQRYSGGVGYQGNTPGDAVMVMRDYGSEPNYAAGAPNSGYGDANVDAETARVEPSRKWTPERKLFYDAIKPKRPKSRYGTAYGGLGIPRGEVGMGDNSRLHATTLPSVYRDRYHEERMQQHGPLQVAVR